MTATKTKERPILFSAPMVRAILAGRKTQTRRIVKPQPIWVGEPGVPFKTVDANPKGIIGCPYGSRGERLWLRETFTIDSFGAGVAQIRYDADNSRGPACGISDRKMPNRTGKVPSIHMPRHASRIILEVTEVRVERLRYIECKPEDARDEGIEKIGSDAYGPKYKDYSGENRKTLTAVGSFKSLWKSINGEDSWQHNPWVWVVSFKRADQ